MNSVPIRLRPHHLIDIMKHFGNGRDLSQPHPYGHAQHEIAMRILSDPDEEIELVCVNDDICRPCRHLDSDNICADVLAQCDPPVSKQTYNDELDRSLFLILAMEPGRRISAREFMRHVLAHNAEIVVRCTHPGQSQDYTSKGLNKTESKWGLV